MRFLTFTGLTGVQFINDKNAVIPLDKATFNCSTGNENLMRLVDGENLTNDANHMWTCEFKQHNTVVLTVKFEDEIFVTGMRVWNYNASLGLSYSGVGGRILILRKWGFVH